MKISNGSVNHNGKTYTYTIKEVNEISKVAIEECNKYINNIMKNT